MEDQIRVHVVRYPGRTNLMMRFLDPSTNKQIARSTGTNKQREAEREAAKWEAELREGRYQPASRMSWDCFRDRFETEGMNDIKGTTVANYASTLNAFENLINPSHLADLTTARVSAFTRELRKPYTITRGKGEKQTKRTAQRSEASVARHLRHLKAVARWANRQGLLPKLPVFDMPKRKAGATRMKGRPITGEEFERMLSATGKAIFPPPKIKPTQERQRELDLAREPIIASWKHLLRGLWASGLRISEAMALRWDYKPGGVSVILSGQKSVLSFDADSQKSGKVQLVPLAPEAVQILEPLQKKTGFVFNPQAEDGRSIRDSLVASKTISAIGRVAGVVVDAERGKFASAHDLRRSFGHRWSRRVMPTVLKELMRHESIETTMNYYVGQNAESTATELWRALGNTLGNTQEAASQNSLEKKYSPQESNL